MIIFLQAVLNLLSEPLLYLETVPVGPMSLQESVLKYLNHADLNNKKNAVQGSSFLDRTIFFLINGKFKLGQMDITLQESMSSDNLGGFITIFDAPRIGEHSMLDCGIGITLTRASAEILFEDRKMEILLDLSKVQLTIFGYESKTRTTYYTLSENLTLRSIHNLYETSFSNLTVTFCWGSPQPETVSSEVDGHFSINNPTIEKERSRQQSSELDISPDIMASFLSRWFLINISIGEILLVKNTVKDVLHGANEMNKLILSLSVGRKFQTVSLEIQVLVLCTIYSKNLLYLYHLH